MPEREPPRACLQCGLVQVATNFDLQRSRAPGSPLFRHPICRRCHMARYRALSPADRAERDGRRAARHAGRPYRPDGPPKPSP